MESNLHDKHTKNLEKYAEFYTKSNLGFDLSMINRAYHTYLPFFTPGKALELGPANGHMTSLLLNYFDDLTIVEGSQILLDQIPPHPSLKKVHSLFENYNPSDKFDTIILNHVLEHIEDPNSLLLKIREWLTEQGNVCIGVPNAKSFHRLAAVKMNLLQTEYSLNERDISLGHYRVYDLNSLKGEVINAGFNVLHEGGIFLKFLSNAQIERFLDDKIVEAYFQLGDDFYYNAAEIYLIVKK